MEIFFPDFPSKTYEFSKNYALIYNNYRAKKIGFDVKIQVGTFPQVFQAHSPVLRMNSNVLEELLPKNKSSVMKLDDSRLTDEIFEVLLDYFYTGKITMNPENIQGIIDGSQYLQLNDLHVQAEEYLLSMMETEPESLKRQKFTHLSMIENKKNCVSNLYGENLFIFESNDTLRVVGKNIKKNHWLFIDDLIVVDGNDAFHHNDSIDHVRGANDDIDVYVSGKEYMIVYGDESTDKSLKIAMGIHYFSTILKRNAYISGSKPLGFQQYDLDSKSFKKLETPPEEVRGYLCIACCSNQKTNQILVIEKAIYHILSDIHYSLSWETRALPSELTQPGVTILSAEDVGGIEKGSYIQYCVRVHYETTQVSDSNTNEVAGPKFYDLVLKEERNW